MKHLHDPMKNAKAAAHIIANSNAVYGFVPNPDSQSIGFHAAHDWTDPNVVAHARAMRLKYHAHLERLYALVDTMGQNGDSVEQIARTINQLRNENRFQIYDDDPEVLEWLKENNRKKYKNETGITADDAYKRYGSWEAVINKALSINLGMDACCGLYDRYYNAPEIRFAIPQKVK